MKAKPPRYGCRGGTHARPAGHGDCDSRYVSQGVTFDGPVALDYSLGGFAVPDLGTVLLLVTGPLRAQVRR